MDRNTKVEDKNPKVEDKNPKVEDKNPKIEAKNPNFSSKLFPKHVQNSKLFQNGSSVKKPKYLPLHCSEFNLFD